MLWNERAFGLYPRHDDRVTHISLVFREMWDTAGLAPQAFIGLHNSTGVPQVRQSVPGPKTMGEAHHSFSYIEITGSLA
jgi:hypothetical protein